MTLKFIISVTEIVYLVDNRYKRSLAENSQGNKAKKFAVCTAGVPVMTASYVMRPKIQAQCLPVSQLLLILNALIYERTARLSWPRKMVTTETDYLQNDAYRCQYLAASGYSLQKHPLIEANALSLSQIVN